mmetsp:Transcript_2931/g.5051  ORF Transcript_2931/g.5051 Transcript_2931/m.5051 type:complete len:219 (+) Transcript_2931:642-1298(+)
MLVDVWVMGLFKVCAPDVCCHQVISPTNEFFGEHTLCRVPGAVESGNFRVELRDSSTVLPDDGFKPPCVRTELVPPCLRIEQALKSEQQRGGCRQSKIQLCKMSKGVLPILPNKWDGLQTTFASSLLISFLVGAYPHGQATTDYCKPTKKELDYKDCLEHMFVGIRHHHGNVIVAPCRSKKQKAFSRIKLGNSVQTHQMIHQALRTRQIAEICMVQFA